MSTSKKKYVQHVWGSGPPYFSAPRLEKETIDLLICQVPLLYGELINLLWTDNLNIFVDIKFDLNQVIRDKIRAESPSTPNPTQEI